MVERIDLSGINGIRINLHVDFNNAIEHIVERVIVSPELENMPSETIAELIHHAILDFDHGNVSKLRSYVESCRQYAKDHPSAE